MAFRQPKTPIKVLGRRMSNSMDRLRANPRHQPAATTGMTDGEKLRLIVVTDLNSALFLERTRPARRKP